jgi:hypothetical protein
MFLKWKLRVGSMPNKRAEELREQAERCRRLADATTNRAVAESLIRLTEEFEARASAEEARNPCGR